MAQSGHCNFGTPYASGTFDWPIPWLFKVGSAASKDFTIVHQRFTIDAAGAMTVSKAGASASKNLTDAIDVQIINYIFWNYRRLI